MSESTVLITALGIVATCVGILGWVIKYIFQEMRPLLVNIHKSIDKNTQQTKLNTDYLKERNGRDSAFWKEVRDALHTIIDKKRSMATTATAKEPVLVIEKPLKRR